MRPCCPFCGEDFHLFITRDDQGNEIAECQIGDCPGGKGFKIQGGDQAVKTPTCHRCGKAIEADDSFDRTFILCGYCHPMENPFEVSVAIERELNELKDRMLKQIQYVDAAKKEALPEEAWTGRPLPEIVKAMKERCDEAWRINESICCHCGKQFAIDDLAVFTASGFVCAKCDVGRMYTALKTAASDGGIVEKEVIRRMVHDMAEPGEAMIPISPDLEQIDQEHRLWPEMDVDVPEE